MKQGLIFFLFLCSTAGLLALGQNAPRPPGEGFGGGEYRIGAEDLLKILVWKEEELTSEVVVRPDGMVSVPLLGDIQASGRTALELQSEIEKKLSRFVNEPAVSVLVLQVNNPKVAVLGEVRKPDWYNIRQKTTVLDAIAMAGGMTEFAGDDVIVIRNHGNQVRRFKLDLDKLLKKTQDAPLALQPGDTVYVK